MHLQERHTAWDGEERRGEEGESCKSGEKANLAVKNASASFKVFERQEAAGILQKIREATT